jgi:hypothetical protein
MARACQPTQALIEVIYAPRLSQRPSLWTSHRIGGYGLIHGQGMAMAAAEEQPRGWVVSAEEDEEEVVRPTSTRSGLYSVRARRAPLRATMSTSPVVGA